MAVTWNIRVCPIASSIAHSCAGSMPPCSPIQPNFHSHSPFITARLPCRVIEVTGNNCRIASRNLSESLPFVGFTVVTARLCKRLNVKWSGVVRAEASGSSSNEKEPLDGSGIHEPTAGGLQSTGGQENSNTTQGFTQKRSGSDEERNVTGQIVHPEVEQKQISEKISASLKPVTGAQRLPTDPSTSASSLSSESSSSNGSTGSQLENEKLKKGLRTLAQALSRLSATLNEVSQTVQAVAEAIQDSGELDVPSLEEKATNITASMSSSPLRNPTNVVEEEGELPERRTHKLAFRLQQAFVQARVEGLGKPFELAMEDFVDACMEARMEGIDLPQVQLLLILAEGSLPSEFSIRSIGREPNPFLAEESRVRMSWIRLVYTTLHLVDSMKRGISPSAPDALEGAGPKDPMDGFVVQTVRLALEEGFDLTRVSLEQKLQGPPTSQAIKMMRQSQFLVLLTLSKQAR